MIKEEIQSSYRGLTISEDFKNAKEWWRDKKNEFLCYYRGHRYGNWKSPTDFKTRHSYYSHRTCLRCGHIQSKTVFNEELYLGQKEQEAKREIFNQQRKEDSMSLTKKEFFNRIARKADTKTQKINAAVSSRVTRVVLDDLKAMSVKDLKTVLS